MTKTNSVDERVKYLNMFYDIVITLVNDLDSVAKSVVKSFTSTLSVDEKVMISKKIEEVVLRANDKA